MGLLVVGLDGLLQKWAKGTVAVEEVGGTVFSYSHVEHGLEHIARLGLMERMGV